MSDIYTAQPWNCGDSDCLFGWHKESFWHYEDGTWTVDRYTDGNHQKCEPEDVPTWEQEEAAWVRYAEDVAETGKDPLSAFTVKRTYTRVEQTVGRKETAITRDLKATAKRYIKRRRKQRKLAADRKHQA